MSQKDPYKYFRIEAFELIDLLYRESLALEKTEDIEKCLKELKRSAHSLKGASRLVELFDIGDLSHELEDELIEIGDNKSGPTKDQITSLLSKIDVLKEQLEQVLNPNNLLEKATESSKEEKAEKLEKSSESKQTSSTDVKTYLNTDPDKEELVHVSSILLDELGREAAGILELSDRISLSCTHFEGLKQSLLPTIDIIEKIKNYDHKSPDNLYNLEEIIDSIKELDFEEIKSQLIVNFDNIENDSESLIRSGEDLHQLSLNTRLISVKHYTYRFEKLARDTSMELGKDIDLQIIGEKTKIDRMVMQMLIEPLSHLIRNSISHGIQEPATRVEQGKSPIGTLLISFAKQGNVLRISIEDDGRGIDLDRLREIAKERNLDENLTEQELHNLLFESGISTSKEVSQVSGRGVGLDVVKEIVQKLRGQINIESKTNEYCRFVIEVPSNLDIMDVFVLKVANQDFLLPLSRVSTSIAATKEDIVEHAGKDVILLDGAPILLYPLDISTGTSLNKDVLTEEFHILVIKGRNELFGVCVDSIKNIRRVVIKKLGPKLKKYPILIGAGIMDDGRPAFLLNTAILEDLCRNKPLTFGQKEEVVKTKKQTVLVVDDSLTTRMLEKTILETAGYKTVLATDGIDALRILSKEHCDLIVVDFEMPRMDGMEFTRTVRQIPEKKDLPIIMLTSIATDENKRKGLSAGVQAYLIKGKFDQNEFIETVRRFIGRAKG